MNMSVAILQYNSCLSVGRLSVCTHSDNGSFVVFRSGRERPTVEVLCWRDVTRGGVRSVGHSLILKLRLAHEDVAPDAAPSVSGWERNERGKMGPRLVNLSASMDPKAWVNYFVLYGDVRL